MSAAQIIEKIRALPPDEQQKVLSYVRSLGPSGEERAIRYMDAEKARKLSDEIFEKNAELFRKLAQ